MDTSQIRVIKEHKKWIDQEVKRQKKKRTHTVTAAWVVGRLIIEHRERVAGGRCNDTELS